MSANTKSYADLQRALQGVARGDQAVSEELYGQVTALHEQWPGQVCLTPHLFTIFCSQNKPTTKADADKKIQTIEKCMSFSQNSTNVQMWKDYADFVDSLETTADWTQNDKDAKMKAVLDRATECVGHTRLDSACIWIKYIDFETTRNNITLVNLLCYMAVQTPFNGDDSKNVLAKYEGILNNLFEKIFQEITQADGQDGSSQIPDRYKSQQAELVKLITGQFRGEKDAFIDHIKKVVVTQAEAKAQAREPYEKSLQGSPALKDWQAYITFEESQGEFKRVTQLYERAMGSTLELQNDFALWMKYAEFIQDKLKDVSLMRAKFE